MKEWRGIYRFNAANVYKGAQEMRNKFINRISIILAMVFTFILALNAFGQDRRADSYREGYGTYDMMGQDPEEILEYGREMMRYGFHEKWMPGGSNKYPGYDRYLGDDTIKKLNAEQEAFIKATEEFRQTIYEKELYLKAELAKKDPDTATALGFQKNISEARGKFEQKMIEHLIRMKKINLEAEKIKLQ
jgi:hypothetical protein